MDPAATDRPVFSASGPPLDVTPVRVARVESAPPSPGPLTIGPVEAVIGAPPDTASPPDPVGTPLLVDAKVGDINGRPVYANDFFEGGPGARLRENAQERGATFEDWRDEAIKLIGSEINRLTTDELLEAEARASLPPPARQGLRAFAEEFGEKQRRGLGGSRAAMERRLLQENRTYEQYVRETEATFLIQRQYWQKIRSRVFITNRDIERYYERNPQQFRPDPKARFRQIRIPTRNASDVQAVQEALDRGDPFEGVARFPANTANPDDGGLREFSFTGELTDAEPFGAVTELNDAAGGLKPGEWTRTPIIHGDWTSWLLLESIERIDRPLSDEQVQLDIIAILSRRKEEEVADKYLKRLQERASLRDLEEMGSRLLSIAVERYWNTRSLSPPTSASDPDR